MLKWNQEGLPGKEVKNMEMKEIIRRKRRECGLTQEQMAEYLGVSTPAVNKWESGATCPDLSIILPLARLLKTDPNTLLGFHDQLTKEEIAVFITQATETARKEGVDAMMEQIRDKIESYPSCGDLLYQSAVMLRGAGIMFGYTGEQKDRIHHWAMELYERASGCDDQNIADMSNYALASMYIEDEEYEKAEKLISYLPDYRSLDKRQLQISMYMKQKRPEEASDLLEKKLIGLLQEVFLNLDQLATAAVWEGEHERAWELADYSKNVMAIYKWDYSRYVVSFSVAMEQKDGEKSVKFLGEMLKTVEHTESILESPLFAHQKKKDQDLSYGKEMLSALLSAIEKEDRYRFLKEREDYNNLIRFYRKRERMDTQS